MSKQLVADPCRIVVAVFDNKIGHPVGIAATGDGILAVAVEEKTTVESIRMLASPIRILSQLT